MSMLQKALTGAAVLAFILLAAMACSKENIQEPVVLTGEVAIHEQDGIVFHGRIIGWGNQKITDHGFLWDTDPTFKNPYKTSLGPPESADFSSAPAKFFHKDKHYYYVAYLETGKGIIRGFNKSTFITDSNLPVLGSFHPVQATWGDTISIRGKFFNTDLKEITAKFGDQNSKIVSVSDSLILLVVPATINKLASRIQLNVAGFQAFSADSLRLLPPLIKDFHPKLAAFNHLITVEGENFPPNSGWSQVFIGGIGATIVKVTSSTIQARVPSGLPEGDHGIEVRVLGQADFSKGKLNLVYPFKLMGSIPSAAANPPIVFQLNNKYYIGGNYLVYADSRSFFEFIPETNAWIQKKDLPVFSQNRGTSFTAAGKAFLLHNNNLFEYETETDLWIPKAAFPGTAANFRKGVSAGNYGYVVMGGTFEFHRYDPHNDSWLRLKDHPEKSGEAFFYDGKVFTLGPANILRAYNPQTDQWEMESSFSAVYRDWCSVVVHENILYGSGGEKNPGARTDYMFSYDLRTKTLQEITPLPASLSRHFSIIYNHKILIGGGGANNLYLFDPELLHPSEKF